MKPLRKVSLCFRALFQKRKLDAEMDEEMRAHIEMLTEANLQAGMNAEEARLAALRRFGWRESIKERCRERRGMAWLENLVRDLRFAARGLLQSPGFTTVAVLTLAMGIGVNVALFTLLDAQLLRPRDLLRPEELWAIVPVDSSGNPEFAYMSRPYYEAIRKAQSDSRLFKGIVGYANIGPRLRTAEGSREIDATLVSGDFFSFLGVRPILGRGFLPEDDDQPGASSVAVISFRFWQGHFQGDPAVVGKTLRLDDQVVEVVGVAPRGFKGINLYQRDLWLPASMEKMFGWYPNYSLLARLRAGVTPSQAADLLAPVVQETTKAVAAGGERIYAKYARSSSQFKRLTLLREGRGSLPALWAWHGRKETAQAAALVGAASLLVLAIAVANLANLLLARALRRRKEMATRLALGATRWTLIRQLLIEGVLLAGLGAMAALIALACSGDFAARIMPHVVFGRADLDLRLDLRVVAFAVASALVAAGGFSILPALQASRLDPYGALRDPDGGIGPRERRWPLRKLLMSGQVAASVVLLTGTAFCVRAMSQLLRLDVGFPTERIVTASPDLEGLGFTTNNAPAAVDELRRRFSMLPGVEAVGMIDWLPLTGERGHLVTDHLEGYAAPDGGRIEFGTRVVGPGCLRALGIPVLEGREVSESDLAAQRAVALVNESFVRKFWPNQAVLGKHLQWRGKSYCEVIGIARDARFNTLAKPPEPTVFYSAGPWECLGPRFVIRVSHDPAALLKPVMAELARLHPALRAQGHVFTMRELMRQPLVAQRETLALLGRLGALALGLTVLGVYGVMSWLVAQRTREIGIRMAVGARRGDVARLILGFGAWVAVAGIGAGLAAAAGGGFLLRHAVFGVRPFDLPSFAMAAGAVLPALLLACAIPVFRATRVDPMNALRCE